MSLEMRFVDGDVLDADNALQPLHFDNGVDEQKRIAMRQYFLDFVDVEYHRRSPPHTPAAHCIPRQTYDYMRSTAVADDSLRC